MEKAFHAAPRCRWQCLSCFRCRGGRGVAAGQYI